MNHDQQEKLPDFNQLNDRIIAPAPKGPLVGARTNLDEKNTMELEQYLHRKELSDKERAMFERFFHHFTSI